VGAGVEDIAFGPHGSLVFADAFTMSRIPRAGRHIVDLEEERFATERAGAIGDCLALDDSLVGYEVPGAFQVPRSLPAASYWFPGCWYCRS